MQIRTHPVRTEPGMHPVIFHSMYLMMMMVIIVGKYLLRQIKSQGIKL